MNLSKSSRMHGQPCLSYLLLFTVLSPLECISIKDKRHTLALSSCAPIQRLDSLKSSSNSKAPTNAAKKCGLLTLESGGHKQCPSVSYNPLCDGQLTNEKAAGGCK